MSPAFFFNKEIKLMKLTKMKALEQYGSLKHMPDNLRIALFGYNEYEEYTQPLWQKYLSTLNVEKKVSILDDIISYDFQIYLKSSKYYCSAKHFAKMKIKDYNTEPEVAEAFMATFDE
jgi:hypothetical protein